MFQQKYSGGGDFLDIKQDGNDNLKVVGKKHNLIRIEVSKILDKMKQYNFPAEWEQIEQLLTGDELCLVIDVKQGTPEWIKIETNFKLTQPQARVEKIERIQNKKLWRVFQNEVEDVSTKLGVPAKVGELYHGTRNTPPITIYKSEEGFDMTYGNQGMWGIANYFAYNSSYSNGYAHPLPNGSR